MGKSNMEEKLRLAILDMNNNVPNQGMRCIREIVAKYGEELICDEFDVRGKNEVPGLEYDLYICSGGPGSPLEGGEWKDRFFELIDSAWQHNQHAPDKKFFFFICHSFQMACEHFNLGKLAPRKSTSFGVYPVHKTKLGKSEAIFSNLTDPYFVVDSRDWQLIQPRLKTIAEQGAQILSLEKIRTHVEYERAIMAVRFSEEFIGTQFHPEADPVGMKIHFEKQENRDKVIKNFGEEKYNSMMEQLDDPDKIALTYDTILPTFIESSILKLKEQVVLS